jgi:hypothetical protein
MSIKGSDPIIGASRGIPAKFLSVFVAPDAKDAAYVNAVAKWAPIAGIDSAAVYVQFCQECTDPGSNSPGTSVRWNRDLNPAGIGIPLDTTNQPVKINDGDEAARIHVQCLYSLVKRITHPGVPIPPAWLPWFNAVWLPKVCDVNAPPAATLADLNIRYVDSDGESRATWAWDAAYLSGLLGYAAKWLSWVADYQAQAPAPGVGGDTPVTVYPSYPVAGLATPIVLPVPLIQSIIPVGQTNQRPGITRQTPGYWVQHETANTDAGADADMHATYMRNGCPDANGNPTQTSWHFTVDDHHIVQHIPITEVTWQSADGSGPGNMSGVSCELCVNSDGDKALIRRNGEALCGTICAALGLTTDQIKRHWDFNQADPDRHHCPDQMMNEGYWPQFVANAGVVIAANTPGAAPIPTPAPTPKPVPTPGVTYARKHPISAESATVAKFGRAYTVKTVVTPRQAADPAAPAVGPDLPVGYGLTAAWVTVGVDSQLWGVGSGGSFIPLSALQ